jgi:hypothetical protein
VLVVTFIALLELAKETLIEITQAEAFAPIYVRLAYTPVMIHLSPSPWQQAHEWAPPVAWPSPFHGGTGFEQRPFPMQRIPPWHRTTLTF